MSSQFRWKNGYALPNEKSIGIGKDPLDVESSLYNKTLNVKRYVYYLDIVLKIFRASPYPEIKFESIYVYLGLWSNNRIPSLLKRLKPHTLYVLEFRILYTLQLHLVPCCLYNNKPF